MTHQAQPSTGQWRELINAAKSFRELEPWNLFEDELVFAVDHPECEDILYCTILGMLGEVLGLGVYPGEQGLQSYYQIASGQLLDGQLPYALQAMLISFESKKYLDKKELRLLKKLGYSFIGPKKWPQFQVYTSRNEALWPDAQQAKHMTVALWAALEVVQQEQNHQGIFHESSAQAGGIPVLRWSSSDKTWIVEYTRPEPGEQRLPQPAEPDEVRLQRLLKSAVRKGIWEGSVLRFPAAVELESGGSYAPPLALWVEHDSFYILGHELGEPGTGWELLASTLLQAMEANGIIPRKILVDTDMALSTLSKLTERLHIEISRTTTLPAIKDVFHNMERGISQWLD